VAARDIAMPRGFIGESHFSRKRLFNHYSFVTNKYLAKLMKAEMGLAVDVFTILSSEMSSYSKDALIVNDEDSSCRGSTLIGRKTMLFRRFMGIMNHSWHTASIETGIK
jgi:hypothetical protein